MIKKPILIEVKEKENEEKAAADKTPAGGIRIPKYRSS